MGFFAKSAQNAPVRGKWVKSPPKCLFLLSACFPGIFLVSSLSAQTGASPPSAERVFNAMLVNIQLLQRVEAGIRLDVYVMEKEYTARGKYEEQRLSHPPPSDFQRSMYRLDLNFVMDAPTVPGSEPNRMTIVCYPKPDREMGRLWEYRSIEGVKTLKYVKLADLEDEIRRRNRLSLFGSVGEVKNLGGLSGALKQIAKFYEFTDPHEETVLEGNKSLPVWRISGPLRPEFLERMIKAFGGLERKTNNYPRQMPTNIEICIGKGDAFPHKIEYHNRPQEDSPKRTVLTRIVYYDVSLNGEPIPEFKFSAFDNGDLPEGVFRADDDTPRAIQGARAF